MSDDNPTNSIESFKFTHKIFLHKSTMVYGESESGKTVIIVNILKTLKSFIDQIIVICPTDPSNHSYSGNIDAITNEQKGIVPSPLIHTQLTAELIEKIYKRQEALAACYEKANRQDILELLFNKIKHKEEKAMKFLELATRQKIEQEKNIRDTYLDKNAIEKKINKISKNFKEFHTAIYKKYIAKYSEDLSRLNLSEDEKHTLKYISLNPNIIIILDDCSADLKDKKIKACPSFNKFFFQGRHVYITFIISLHSDIILDTAFRRNAFVNIFTTRSCASAYFERTTNAFDPDAKRKAKEAIQYIQPMNEGFRKIAYIRTENKFYTLAAEKDDNFSFGCPALRYFCDKIKIKGASTDSTNPFNNYFK
jgi:hypothetical protein